MSANSIGDAPQRAEHAGVPRPGRGVRKRDAAATRMALLVAARLRFSEDGYEHTTVRDIASDVGVNQALVFRYFGSKDGLFDEAAQGPNPMAAIADVPLEQVPETILRLMLDTHDDGDGLHPLIALLRSTGHEEARQRLRAHLDKAFTDEFAGRLEGPDVAVRAELFAAWMLGIGVLRQVVGASALSSATFEELRGPFQRGADALLRDAAAPPE